MSSLSEMRIRSVTNDANVGMVRTELWMETERSLESLNKLYGFELIMSADVMNRSGSSRAVGPSKLNIGSKELDSVCPLENLIVLACKR
jgi:hypothetical protein